MVVTPKNAVNDGSSNFKDGSNPAAPTPSPSPPPPPVATAAEIRAGSRA